MGLTGKMPSRRTKKPYSRKLYCGGHNTGDGNGGYLLHTSSYSRGKQVSAVRWWFYRLVLGR